MPVKVIKENKDIVAFLTSITHYQVPPFPLR